MLTSTCFARGAGAKADVEPVGEHERVGRRKGRRNGFFVQLGLSGVRRENHDDIGPARSFRWRFEQYAVLFGPGARSTPFGETDHDGSSRVAEIQGVRVTLRTVANDRDLLALHERQVR